MGLSHQGLVKDDYLCDSKITQTLFCHVYIKQQLI